MESLRLIVELSKDYPSKFIRSAHLVKFFDSLMLMMEDSNQKIQIESLTVLKSELRMIVKVCEW